MRLPIGKILLSVLCCAMIAGCEFEFDVRSDAKPGLYVQCMADASADRLGIRLEYAAPAQGNTNDIPALSLSRFMVALDGVTVEVTQDSVGHYSAALPSSCSHVEIEVEADGLPAVSSSCTIPRSIAIDSLGHSRDTIMMLPIDIFTVALAEQPEEGEYVAIRLVRETWEDGSLTEEKVLSPMLGTSTDIETEVAQVSYSGNWIVENGSRDGLLTVAPASAFSDGSMVLPVMDFDSMFPPSDEKLPSGGVTQSPDEGEERPETLYVYKVQAVSVSESFYRYALACHKSNTDFMAMMGMAPANFAWSNVEGGFGVCAAIGIWSEAYASYGPAF